MINEAQDTAGQNFASALTEQLTNAVMTAITEAATSGDLADLLKNPKQTDIETA